jgi:hypothetical protein
MYQSEEIKIMLGVIQNCIKEDKLEFLANLITTLQKEYQEIASLSTDGEYRSSWTHRQVLDYLTYLPQK